MEVIEKCAFKLYNKGVIGEKENKSVKRCKLMILVKKSCLYTSVAAGYKSLLLILRLPRMGFNTLTLRRKFKTVKLVLSYTFAWSDQSLSLEITPHYHKPSHFSRPAFVL
jgi:hypothetical protein